MSGPRPRSARSRDRRSMVAVVRSQAMTTADQWPSVRVLQFEHHPGAQYSSMVDVQAYTSRRLKPEWSVLFAQALRLDPDDREGAGIRAQMAPMIWATVPPERAATIDDQIREAAEVANLRYRSQWLPTLPAAEVSRLVEEAIAAEGQPEG